MKKVVNFSVTISIGVLRAHLCGCTFLIIGSCVVHLCAAFLWFSCVDQVAGDDTDVVTEDDLTADLFDIRGVSNTNTNTCFPIYCHTVKI